jgi:hypothetical protein
LIIPHSAPIAEIRIDDGGINWLTTEQGQRIVSACGERDDLTSCVVNHEIKIGRYELIVLNHEDARTI